MAHDTPLPQRKQIRLKEFNYSDNHLYFITICAKDRKKMFGNIVGYGACDVPHTKLSEYGKIIEKYILWMDNRYDNVFVDKYIIMPNHIHMIIAVSDPEPEAYDNNIKVSYFGTSQAPYPTDSSLDKTTLTGGKTPSNGIIPKFISLFKRYCNQEIGHNIWQRRYYDHVIRTERDYRDI